MGGRAAEGIGRTRTARKPSPQRAAARERRPDRRPRRPRLQQHAGRDHQLRRPGGRRVGGAHARVAGEGSPLAFDESRSRRGRAGGRARGATDASAAQLLAPDPDRPRPGRSERLGARGGGAAAAHARPARQARDRPRRPAGADPRRPGGDRPPARQPGNQQPRRDARRGDCHGRHRKRRDRSGVRGPTTGAACRQLRAPARIGYGDRHGTRHPRTRLRPVLHDQAAGRGHRAGPHNRLRHGPDERTAVPSSTPSPVQARPSPRCFRSRPQNHSRPSRPPCRWPQPRI